MKKIAKLTFHNTTNYGAILQTYALQKKIESMGLETEVINYECKAVEDRYRIKDIRQSKSIKEIIKAVMGNKDKKKLLDKFQAFAKKYIKISSKKYAKSNIKECNSIYNRIIVGSDQVWNLNLSGNDFTYFLDFVDDNNKKCSYAASFGTSNIMNQNSEKLKQLLNEFKYINIREKQGYDIINSLLGRKANIVLDPTLLLDYKDWKKIIPNIDKKVRKKFVLLYIIAPNKDIIRFAKKIAKSKKCEVIYINHSLKKIQGVKNLRGVGPEDFLWYINNAECIITTSFHGVAFSINFNKTFYFALSKEKNNFNSRIESLVEKLELQDRNIELYNNAVEEIHYDKINEILEKEKEQSEKCLEEMLITEDQ